MIKYKKKTVLVISSSRADYGILSNLLKKIHLNKKFDLKIIVTGSHLDRASGFTYKEIIKDGLKIYDYLKIDKKFYENNSNYFSTFVKKIGIMTQKASPDIVMLLGDRKEIFASALSCFINNFKLVHISGGEKTIGSKDDTYRHLISKMSDFHFVSESDYKKRLIQLGELSDNILVTGSLSSENINLIKFKIKKDIQQKYNFKFFKKNILVTFHPDTSMKIYKGKDFAALIKLLAKKKNFFIIFTSPNMDQGNDLIIKSIYRFIKKNNNSIYIKSLGKEDYLSILKIVDVVIGNSSSGITEAPLLKTLTLNIGNRQDGRLMSSSIASSEASYSKLSRKFNELTSSKIKYYNFKKVYFKKKSASVEIIKKLPQIINKRKIIKNFIDLN